MERDVETFFEKKIKPAMCHDNFTGNLFYWAWKDLDCTCCAFFRGMLMGIVATAVIALVI